MNDYEALKKLYDKAQHSIHNATEATLISANELLINEVEKAHEWAGVARAVAMNLIDHLNAIRAELDKHLDKEQD